MNPYGDIDLTRYLQTEGRRRAAALAKARRHAPADATDAQQQCAIPDQPKKPASLSEVLVQMGVTPSPRK
jgi:hypothetical protein